MMEGYQIITEKLQHFTRKYYKSELLKGTILFFSLGCIYFFVTLFIESFLWLQPLARTALFLDIYFSRSLFIGAIYFKTDTKIDWPTKRNFISRVFQDYWKSFSRNSRQTAQYFTTETRPESLRIY